MIIKGSDKNQITILLGIFAFAVFRIIPSFSKILNSFQQIKFYIPSLNIVHKYFKSNNKLKDKKLIKSSFNSIKFSEVSFGYRNKNLTLENINFTLRKGDNIGIIGKSGSGKSTFINLLVNLLKPNSGNIYLNNNLSLDSLNLSKIFGYVSQSIFLSDDSILNNIAFGIEKDNIDLERVKIVLKLVELNDFVDNLPEGIFSSVGERGMKLSGGQIQRIGIARALYSDPEIIIFDESTSALDSLTEKKIIKTIYSLGKIKTLIIISHKKELLNNCDSIYLISNQNLKKI